MFEFLKDFSDIIRQEIPYLSSLFYFFKHLSHKLYKHILVTLKYLSLRNTYNMLPGVHIHPTFFQDSKSCFILVSITQTKKINTQTIRISFSLRKLYVFFWMISKFILKIKKIVFRRFPDVSTT